MSDVIAGGNETIFTDVLLQRIQEIPEEYRSKPETQLRKLANPTLKLYEVKRSFWNEMKGCEESGKRFNAMNVYRNLTTKEYFYGTLLKHPVKMAWILSPMVEYEIKTKAILDSLTDRYQELVNMEITTTKRRKNAEGAWEEYTETDPKKAAVLLQVIRNVEDRVRGLAIQKQITINATEPREGRATLDMETVTKRLKELEEKLGPAEIAAIEI